MAKKPPANPQLSPGEIQGDPTAIPQLSDYLGSLGQMRPRVVVAIYRILTNGRWSALDTYTGDKIDEFIIRRRHGGGDYIAQVKDPSTGQVVKTMKVEIDPSAIPDIGIETAPPAQQLGGTGDIALRAELAELKSMFMQAIGARAPSMDLQGIAALMAAMQGNALKPADLLALVAGQQRTPITEMIGAVEKLAELRGLGAPDDGGGDLPEAPVATVEEQLLREIVGLGKEWIAMKRDARRPDRAAPTKRVDNQATRPSTPAAEPAPTAAKRSAIDRLAMLVGTNAAAEIDAEICADAVVDFITRNAAELNGQFTYTRPLADQLIERAPGLSAHAEYVASVEAAARAMAAGQHEGHDDESQTAGDAGSTQGDQQ